MHFANTNISIKKNPSQENASALQCQRNFNLQNN